jgi:tetratricopeptide (TPR) repeat protein
MKALLFLISLLAVRTAWSQDIEALSKLYGSGAYAELDRQCIDLLKTFPDHPEINMLYGRSLADQEQTVKAIGYLSKAAVSNGPAYVRAWSYAYLGTCYFTIDSIEKSRASLLKCVELNATKNATGYANRRISYYGFSDHYKDWEVIESKHFRFLFQDSSNVKNKMHFIEERESVFEELVARFPATLPGKIDFFVWNSTDDGVNQLGASPGFARPEELLVHCRYNQTVGHEMTHIIVHHSLHPKTKSRLINEGIAVLYDFSSRLKMDIAKLAASSSTEPISIKDMWMRGAAFDESLLYPVGGAWLGFLETKLSGEGFRQILQNQSYEAYPNRSELESLIAEFESLLNSK